MTESMKYYESIRRKYPETVSKDQFYQIAHISKATALHLLQNGLRADFHDHREKQPSRHGHMDVLQVVF